MSGCLWRLYGLSESRARTPNIPITPLKMLACSKYSSMSSSAFSSTNSIALPMCAMVSPGGSGTPRSKPSFDRATVDLAISAQVYNTVALDRAGCAVNGNGRQHGDGFLRHAEESRVDFNANAGVPDRHGGGHRGPRAHERVEHSADSEREGSSHDLAHEGLRLQ